MSVRKTDSGRWRADVRPAGRDDRRFRREFSTQGEALNYERWVMREHSLDDPWSGAPRSDSRRLSELVWLWFELHGQTLKDGAERVKLLEITALALGDPRADQLTAKEYVRYRADRLRNVSANTCNHELAYVRAVYNELTRAGEIACPNPLADIRPLKVDQTELAYLDERQIRELLSALDEARGSHSGAIARVGLATAARWVRQRL